MEKLHSPEIIKLRIGDTRMMLDEQHLIARSRRRPKSISIDPRESSESEVKHLDSLEINKMIMNRKKSLLSCREGRRARRRSRSFLKVPAMLNAVLVIVLAGCCCCLTISTALGEPILASGSSFSSNSNSPQPETTVDLQRQTISRSSIMQDNFGTTNDEDDHLPLKGKLKIGIERSVNEDGSLFVFKKFIATHWIV